MHRLERRGLLHCEVDIPGWSQRLHTINVHLGLLKVWRQKQLDALIARIERLVPHDAPVIIAGDFNDWTRRASRYLIRSLDVLEVFETYGHGPARSFPASAAAAASRPHLRARLPREACTRSSRSGLGAHLRSRRAFGFARTRVE